MLKKNLAKTQTKRGNLVSKIYLYLGIVILVSALFYMIGNLHKADEIVHLWLPIMGSGTILVFISLILKKYHESTTDKK
jgi:FtsH-binding integral membrane protein